MMDAPPNDLLNGWTEDLHTLDDPDKACTWRSQPTSKLFLSLLDSTILVLPDLQLPSNGVAVKFAAVPVPVQRVANSDSVFVMLVSVPVQGSDIMRDRKVDVWLVLDVGLLRYSVIQIHPFQESVALGPVIEILDNGLRNHLAQQLPHLSELFLGPRSWVEVDSVSWCLLLYATRDANCRV